LENLVPNSKELLEQFFIKLKERLHKNLNLFNENSVSYFLEYALSNLWNLNKDVEFNNSGSIHKGKLIGLSNNYEVILDIDRKNRTFNSGEISI
jgi:biotin-(acetyl-CoA carboxylase) ligase